MTDERHRLPCLIDLTRQSQNFFGAPQLVGRESSRNHEGVVGSGIDFVDVGVDGDGIAAFSRVGALPHPRDRCDRSFFLEPNLRIPKLKILVGGRCEEENAFAFERHARNLYLSPL